MPLFPSFDKEKASNKMRNKIINIGVLGCANIAKHSVIPAMIEQNHLFCLKGIASRDGAKAESVASKFGCTPFGSYQSILEAGDLDAVYIPLPNSLHAEWVERALDSGLHVLVEKSLACTFDEVADLNHKAKNKVLALVENFQFRFHGQLSEILKILKSGKIGELRCVRSFFGFPPFPNIENIRYQKELGGGALLDAGAYTIKIAQVLLGDDLEVKAAALSMDLEKNVDIWGGGFLQQRRGKHFSEIAFGFDHFYQCGIELWGSKGRLRTNRLFTAPRTIEPEVFVESVEGKETVRLRADNHFNNMLEHFYQTIHSPELANDEYQQNINQARLIHEFRKKANE